MFNKMLVFVIFCFMCPSFSMEEIGIKEPNVNDFILDSEEAPMLPEGFNFLQKDRMPKHISFIMDGNRRWARQRGLTENEGHAQGANVLMKLLKFFSQVDLGIETITLYAFSTENWKRSETEVNFLMDLCNSYFDEILPHLQRYSIRFETIGDLTKFPLELQEKLQILKNLPLDNPKYTLVLGLNYGGRDEIKRAFAKMALDLEKAIFTKEEISEDLIQRYLDTSFIKDPDLLIRTSGELRISNFLLWQIAYAELYFSPSLWPDFSEQELVNVLLEFQKRERRFGGCR